MRSNQYQGGKQLKKALEYIDEHYGNEELSLGQVAEVVGMSSNYFSAIFSQNMEKTFVGNVTESGSKRRRSFCARPITLPGDREDGGLQGRPLLRICIQKAPGLKPERVPE